MRDKDRHFRPSQLPRLNTQLPFTFFPPSPHQPEHRHLACGTNGHLVRCFRHSKLQTCWPRTERLAHGKSYPSYSSATAPDSHGISCADPLFQARKELSREVAACARRFKIYLIDCVLG